MMNRINWSLVKLSDDLGVFHVGGKTGARFGPDAFESCFKKFRGNFDALLNLDETFELENRNGKIRDHLNEASKLIKNASERSNTTIVVGGGHDFGYAQLKGIKDFLNSKYSGSHPDDLEITCINLDAHFDLRKPNPEITSGSPFYLAIEEKIIKGENLIEFGIQSHCNSKELWTYANKHKIIIESLHSLRQQNMSETFKKILSNIKTKYAVLQLDLDCMSESFAPGVSAPQADGFNVKEILDFISLASRDPRFISFGIFELNPLYDQNQKTARLSAKAAYTFLEERKK